MAAKIYSLTDKLSRRSRTHESVAISSDPNANAQLKPLLYDLEVHLKDEVLHAASRSFQYHKEVAADLSRQTRENKAPWGYRDMYARAASHAFAALKAYGRLQRCVALEGARLMKDQTGGKFPLPMPQITKYRDELKFLGHTLYAHAYHEFERVSDTDGLESIAQKYDKRCQRFGSAFEMLLDLESVRANAWFSNMAREAFRSTHNNISSEDINPDEEHLQSLARFFVSAVGERLYPSDPMLPKMKLYTAMCWEASNMQLPQPYNRFLTLIAEEGPILPKVPGIK